MIVELITRNSGNESNNNINHNYILPTITRT